MTVYKPLIRGLKREDFNEIKNLIATRASIDNEGVKKRVELMEWLAFSNPSADLEETTYFVVENQGKIIAFHGRMPNYFFIDGKSHKGYYVHDLYVDPEYRKMGKGFWITMSLANAIEKESTALICLSGMTSLNLQMQRRRKYLETNADIYWKTLIPYKAVQKAIKNRRLAKWISVTCSKIIRIIDIATKPKVGVFGRILQVKRFDASFDSFLGKVIPKMGFQTYKDSQYLNWKYIDRPYSHEVIYAVEKERNIFGFIILAFQKYEDHITCKVVDFMADPQDNNTILALLNKAIKLSREKNVTTIQCVITNKVFKKVLKKLWFYKGKGSGGRKTLMLGNLNCLDSISQNKISNINNWHFTDSESDAEMLRY